MHYLYHVFSLKGMRHIKLIGTAYPYRGGLAAYNERLGKEFQDKGYSFDIETFTLQYPNILFPGKTQYAECEAPEKILIKRSVNSINPVNWLSVGKRIKKEKPDLVLMKYWTPFMSPCFGTIGRLARKNGHTKLICIADNIIPHEKRIVDKQFTKYFLNTIDGLVAMSKSVLDDALMFRKDIPTAICQHPIFDNFGDSVSRDEAIEQLGLDPHFRYMLFFGFIRDYKGLDLLLKAIAHPQLKEQPVKLIVAGEFYTDSKPYYDLIEEIGITNKLVMADKFISNNDVYKYFCAADIVVQPYKDATQSGVTQIGYHFNKPMLVTDVGGLSEIIPHGKVGYVVKPDVEAIAQALVDFYENQRKEEFESHVIEEKKKFSWANMVNTIENVYKQII